MHPTLVLACDRLEPLEKVIQSVGVANLGPIYVSCDYPRPGKNKDNSIVVKYLETQLSEGNISFLKIRKKNEGISKAIEDGIDWFFSQVEFGVVLEDDVVLSSDASQILTNGLVVMSKEEDVKAINLRNTVPSALLEFQNRGFRKSSLVSSHGWATTSRVWNDFRKCEGELSGISISKLVPPHLGKFHKLAFLETTKKNQRLIQTREYNWDTAWQLFFFKNHYSTINSNCNAVNYIGYRSDSTHDQKSQRKKEKTSKMTEFFTLDFKSDAVLEMKADRFRFKTDMRHTFPRFIVRKLKINKLIPNLFNW